MTDDEIWCDVSDDEMYNPGKEKKGTWEPKAEDILRLFDELKTKKVLDLHWKCPGRRPPDSEDNNIEESTKEELLVTPVKQEEKKAVVPNEFDFDDDEPSGFKTVITPRRTPGSAPKSQKKEARMDKILKDIMQQRKLQAAEREAKKLAGAKSPRTPSSPSRARIGSPAGSPRTPNRQSPVRVGAGFNDGITNTPSRIPTEVPMPTRIVKNEQNSNISGMKPEEMNQTSLSTAQVTSSSEVLSAGNSSFIMNSSQVKEVSQSSNVTSSQQTLSNINQIIDSTSENKSLTNNTVQEKMDTT
ncbi:PAXIP1-associated glutamate-rich protein 1 [Mactra antiquata]